MELGHSTSLISTFVLVYGMYEKLLHVDYRSAGDRFDRIRIQLLTQRTRLRYVGDMMQLDSVHLSSESESVLKYCLQEIEREYRKISEIERHYPTLQADSSLVPTGTKLSGRQKMRWAMRDRESMEVSLIQLKNLIDSIELILPQPKIYRFGSEGVEPSTMKGKDNTTFSRIPTKYSGLPDEDDFQAQEEAQELFRALCFICEKSLKMVSSHSATLKDTFLSYLLWARTINSENVVAIFTQSPVEIDDQNGPDLLKIHYELLAQMAQIFIQTSEAFNLESQESGKETFSELHTILSKVQDAGIDDFCNDFWSSDQNEDNFEAVQTFATAELRILVDSLLCSLPSLLHKSQLQQVKASLRVPNAVTLSADCEVEQQASTKELLEVAVQLTAGISKAFDEMYKDQTSRISIEESLKDLYNKEVTSLLTWKEANGSKLGGKITVQNQGVWETLQATVFNMTDLLNSMSSQAKASNANDSALNAKADILLADYARKHERLDLAVEVSQHQDINEMVRDFREFVHALVTMQAPLGAIEPPPTYEKRHGDEIILNK